MVLVFGLVQVFEVFRDLLEERVCRSLRLQAESLRRAPLRAGFGLLRVGLGALGGASARLGEPRVVLGAGAAFFGVAPGLARTLFAVGEAFFSLGLFERFSAALFEEGGVSLGEAVPGEVGVFFDEDDGEVVFFADGGGAGGLDVVQEVWDLVEEVAVGGVVEDVELEAVFGELVRRGYLKLDVFVVDLGEVGDAEEQPA